MDFPTCGSTATYLLMLLFTLYKTIHDLPPSAVSLAHCITCQDVCVFTSHVQGSHSVVSNKPRLHTEKKTYSHHNAILDNQKTNLDHCDRKCTELRMHLFIVENELHLLFQILNLPIAYTCASWFQTVLKSGLFPSCVEFRITVSSKFN